MKARKMITTLVPSLLLAAALTGTAAWAQSDSTQPSGATETPPTQPAPTPSQSHKQLRQTLKVDREKLRQDVQKYGKESDQVKADRAQIKKDIQALRAAHG